jgi:uncharacterized protein YdeI (YjbR/CyaY-like superfamily)
LAVLVVDRRGVASAISKKQRARPSAKMPDGSTIEVLMGKKDPRVDAYIAKSADFARPILSHLRAIVHKACPEVEETMKWSMPHFDYKGIMCGMSAFKAHCAFGFWKASLVLEEGAQRDAMGHFGRITSRRDLPPDRTLIAYVKKAADLNDRGVTVARKPAAPKKPVRVPPDLAAALKRSAAARQRFDAFSPSHKREYVEWIVEAKTDATRKKRVTTALEWIAEGKGRNWKYLPK